MKSLLEGLPPEVVKRIHPDWQKNETEYWALRDTLLPRYQGQWVGFANSRVIVAGTSPVEVFHTAQASGQHPFVTCVGHEYEPNRMRRTSFACDSTYPNEPLPVLTAEFRTQPGQSGIIFSQVVSDTGADASALPWSDCERLALAPSRRCAGINGWSGRKRYTDRRFSGMGISRRC